jgi:DNA repair protein RecN (Recombination protein N)
MLTDLLIKNYVLIEELQMQPHKGLNIITGETGAGKSIMLGAIGLLLGNRADLKVMYHEEEKCVIEGTFRVEDYQLEKLFRSLELDYEEPITIRREISPSGKSRAFVNDTPVNLEALKQIGAYLIDVHSQHDNLLLSNNEFQLRVVDAYAANAKIKELYQNNYQQYTEINRQYRKLQNEYAAFQKEYDYNRFLLDELAKAAFREGEQEELEAEGKLLESAEEVKSKLTYISGFLSQAEPSVNDGMRVAVNQLTAIAELSPLFADLRERLESCRIELTDIAHEVEREEEKIEFNPARIEEVQNRLSLIYNLQKKHQVSAIAELLAIQADLEEKVSKVLNFDEEIRALKTRLDEAYQSVLYHAEQLSQTRQGVFEPIENEVKSLLTDLGMPNATLKIERNAVEPSPDGMDLINFLFSANKGIPPQEIGKVASGGEFSRLMLAIKYILAGKTSLPTIIFDEIDTGISGEIALKMGKMFQFMANRHQIISISHLHQIAAKGNHHYFVYKDDSADRTISRIKQLNEDERIYEIAQMISGSKPSESAILSAKELLMS